MNKMMKNTLYCLLVAVTLSLQGCGLFGKKGKGSDQGELVGAGERPTWKQTIPYGIGYCSRDPRRMGSIPQIRV